ncbi:MAG: polysaccharide pyruvyl transferase family protein [Acidaminococcaceae bacterium]|nr:polysaccharide pyruvyl transferase family protein [Acidaminococcaceae bacterium]
MQLVTLPHLTGKILADIDFGDEQLYDVSPSDFLSLIKYAECVFTDSFHGSVISLLYHKQFYTFSRLNMPHMDNRMISLLGMFDAEARFLNTAERMTLGYVEQLQDFDYSQKFSKFEEMKKTSMEFLEKSLR